MNVREQEASTIAAALEDPERLAALHATGLLDAESTETLDRYVRLVKNAIGAPVALVSLVDDHRQFFSSAMGLDDVRETPLSHSFCKHVVAGDGELVVPDANADSVLKDNAAVNDLQVVAYAGVPIRTSEGHVLGSFCAIDTVPREWTDIELAVLRDLAAGVSAEMNLRLRVAKAESSEAALAEVNRQLEQGQVQTAAKARAAVHDVRTPLSVLALGVAQLGAHDASKTFPEIAKLLGMLERNLEHAASLVASMHDVTPASSEPAIEERVDLVGLARDVTAGLARDGIDLRFESRLEAAYVLGASSDLRRCIENLVSNALRFATSRIVVRVSQSDEDDEIVLRVLDDGDGLPSREAYAAVWRPNTRFHEESGKSGSGLGLSIVREIIERGGGHVRARPAKSGGAMFMFLLPRA